MVLTLARTARTEPGLGATLASPSVACQRNTTAEWAIIAPADTGAPHPARLAAAGVGPALLPDNAIPAGLDAAILPCRPKRFRELTCYLRSQPHGLVLRFLTLLQDTAPLTQPTHS